MGAPVTIQLASLGMADSLILMVLALVVFGPRRLPQIGRQIGKLMYEFRKASNDFKFQMEEELRLSEDADRRKKEEAERAARTAALPPPTETIEAQADIGAVEQVSVSAQPAAGALPAVAGESSPYPGEGTYPSEYPVEGEPAHGAESAVTLPRTTPLIQPPSTGEQVQATRPGSSVVAPPAESYPEPEPTASESAHAELAGRTQSELQMHSEAQVEHNQQMQQGNPPDNTPTEPVSHHG